MHSLSKTSSAKPGHTSLLEELMAKISLRNIPINDNSETSPQIPRATQNSQPKICETPRNWKRNPSSNTTRIPNSAGMDGRNCSNPGGRWPNSHAMDPQSRGNQQSAELSGTTTMTTLSHDFILPPLRNVTPIRSSNSYTKLNASNNRQFTPGGFNHSTTLIEDGQNFGQPTAMDSNTQYRCVTPQSPQWKDRRPFSASKQIPPRGNFSREIEDFEFPVEQHSKDFHLPQIRNLDEFHLPPIQFKQQRQIAGQIGGSGSRPQTAFYGTHLSDPSRSVSEVVRMFEQNSPQNRPRSHASNNRSPLMNPCETVPDEPMTIQPDDDCPTRIGKIRKTLQQFDQSVPLYERCTTIGGTTELDYRTPKVSKSQSFVALQGGSKEDFPENKNIDRSSLVRVTKFKAAKSTRKSSKTKLRTSRENGTGGSKPSEDKGVLPTLNNNLHEFQSEEVEFAVVQKPSWMRRIVETGSEVQQSVLNTWDCVNSQVGSKLRSVYGSVDEVENNDSMDGDTQME